MLNYIQGVTGKQYLPGSPGYEDAKSQMATSSYGQHGGMSPGLIVEARSMSDVIKTVQYAKDANLAVALRSGGHGFLGQSSTNAANIQLDVCNAFKEHGDRRVFKAPDSTQTFMRISVSYTVGDINEYLRINQLFVPTGQSTTVGAGGHVQTGGYGQMIRSFGLLGDHVTSLEIVDCNAKAKEVTRDSDPELFYGILGGSPGNFGVVTHFTLKVYRDVDYEKSCGLKVVYPYSASALQQLLTMVEEMAGDVSLPSNYDFSVRVASENYSLSDILKSHSAEVLAKHPEWTAREGTPQSIVAYASFVPYSHDDKADMAWFDRINTVAEPLFSTGVQEKPMSQLATWWLHSELHFAGSYNHRLFTTPSAELSARGWSSWMTDRVDEILSSKGNKNLSLYCRFDLQGGEASCLSANANNSTAYAWRDSTIMAQLVLYHGDNPAAKTTADSWFHRVELEGIGPSGVFASKDRRLFWAAHGKVNLHMQRAHYFENEEKYERLMKTRRDADPKGTFTANMFCVKKADKDMLAPAVMNTSGKVAKVQTNEEGEVMAVN